MTDEPLAEWHDRAAFAEIAEALGVSTRYILAVHGGEGVVLWTPSETDDGDIWGGIMQRDADGILHVINRRFFTSVAEFQARADEEIRKRLEEELGPPSS